MKLKIDDKGNVVIADGKPVYVHEDGKEIPFDAAQAVATISRLNGEAKGHREAKEEALNRLKMFDGIEDPALAKKAIEIVKNLDDKKLVDAGEVEKIKAGTAKAFEDKIRSLEEKYAPVVKERDSLQSRLVAEKIGGAFARSKMIADKLAIPADIVQARFGDAFKLEGDAIVAYDNSGNKIFSRTNPGNVAGFDEALDILVEAYPHRDSILKGSGASGSGANGGGGAGGKRTMTRSQFEKLAPVEAREAAAAMGAGSLTITD